MESKNTPNSHAIVFEPKKLKKEGITASDFKVYYKIIVTETA
jgi:hypothetical protein